MHPSRQTEIDDALLAADASATPSTIGTNTIAAVSLAVLCAGARRCAACHRNEAQGRMWLSARCLTMSDRWCRSMRPCQ